MFSFFSKKKQDPIPDFVLPLADIHSHLLPGIDDGSQSLEESVALVRSFAEMGYQKLITTPHIMMDFYKNTPEIIHEKLQIVRQAVQEAGLSIELEAAAEYYLDEGLMQLLRNEQPLLTFGKEKYLLFELSFMNESHLLDQAVFMMQSQGYRPVLAHPERYLFFTGKLSKLAELRQRGVLLQVNINSLAGYYSRASAELAASLVKNDLVSFLGTDCHKQKHLDFLEANRQNEWLRRATNLNLLNNSLL